MKVKELIEQLWKINPEANVFTGYDGNIVVAKAGKVLEVKSCQDIQNCWFSVHTGDVVILEG